MNMTAVSTLLKCIGRGGDVMGWKYEVNVWDSPVDGPYYWLQIYAGESLLKAIYNVLWAKHHGWKCIKLEYRP